MNRRFGIWLLFLPLFGRGQIITTFAGGGSGGAINGVPATAITLSDPLNGVFDAHGNYYFVEGLGGNRVRKIDTAGIATTVAGTGVGGFYGDGGPATNAELNLPGCAVVDSVGNLYIGDGQNYRIRKVSALTGIISTIAGNGIAGFTNDGVLATASEMGPIRDICFDKAGNLYFADYGNARVRRISTSGIISTVAGNGIAGYSGDGCRADTSKIGGISGICFDATGNLYLADNSNARVFKINTSGIISTVAGTSSGYLFNGDEIPATDANIDPNFIACDKWGNLFVSETYNYRVRRIDASGIIHTVAGIGTSGFSGDGGPATAAQFHYPSGIALDSCNNLFIPEANNNRVRKVTYSKCDYLNVESEKIAYSDLMIYPNPCESDLNINGLKTSGEYVLLDITLIIEQRGKLKAGNNTIQLNAHPPGLYFLELTDEQGSRTVRKILKQ